jgi:hypothetical protein
VTRLWLGLAISVRGICACGSTTESYELPPPVRGEIALEQSSNLCPIFRYWLLLPRDVRPDLTATIQVKAIDPDTGDQDLRFSWHATSGYFSEPQAPTTEYSCTELGAQALTLTARDLDDCESILELEVQCLAD